jgi:hypothetical protein
MPTLCVTPSSRANVRDQRSRALVARMARAGEEDSAAAAFATGAKEGSIWPLVHKRCAAGRQPLALALQPTKPTSTVSAVHALTQPPAVGAAPRLARSHLGTRPPKCYSSARPPRQSFRASLLPPHLTQAAPTCTLDYRAATVHGASEGMRSSPISAYLPISMPQRCASDRVGCATV